MTRNLIAIAKTPSELHAIDVLVHDQMFSCEEFALDRERNVLTIPIWTISDMKVPLGVGLRRGETAGLTANNADYELEIQSVDNVEVIDPDKIVEHSVSHFELPTPNRLIIRSNFPGHLEVHIRELDISVFDLRKKEEMMVDETLSEFVDKIYALAHKAKPLNRDGSDVEINVDDGRLMAGLMNFLILHMQATETAVRKIAEKMDQKNPE